MTDARNAWTEVADRFSALCLKLKLHAEEELSEDDVREKAGLDKLRATLDEVVDAIGDAYEDEAVRADAKDLGRAFAQALDATLDDVRGRIKAAG